MGSPVYLRIIKTDIRYWTKIERDTTILEQIALAAIFYFGQVLFTADAVTME